MNIAPENIGLHSLTFHEKLAGIGQIGKKSKPIGGDRKEIESPRPAGSLHRPSRAAFHGSRRVAQQRRG
jgi:hypothetical protein